ncbi:MAG: hypothetical protein IAF58_15125 [Leptolyngbya sp.]|nr:hypothetical protein [Candidatus Melainabacteria bacterium]
MTINRKRGATLALVAALTLVLVIVGLGFFFLLKIYGGGRELQHAVDAGNLNVAKQSMRRPFLRIFGLGSPDLNEPIHTIAKNNFMQAKDPAVGELDLLTYNRAVGQAMLVGINAASDNYGYGAPNPQGIANAKTLVNVLSDPSEGIGVTLAEKLKNDVQQDMNFSQIASITPMKMLNPGGPGAGAVSGQKEISYMARNFGTNLTIGQMVLPTEFVSGISPGFLSGNTVSKRTSVYVKGYSLINIPGITDSGTHPLMGVPLRPQEKPHLVATPEFYSNTTSPLPGGTQVDTRVPPNAFHSAGSSIELKSAQSTMARSCAIVGSVDVTGEYSASIPCGYIAIANGDGPSVSGAVQFTGPAGGMTDNAYGGGPRDIFSDLLMTPVYVTPSGNAMDTNLGDINAIKNFKADPANAGLPVPAALVNALDGPAPKQQAADSITPSTNATSCDNYNSTPTSPNANPNCYGNLDKMATTYGFALPDGSPSGSLTGLMAIEKYKAQVINPRPGGGPAIVTGLNNVCTGMKAFPLGGISHSEGIEFGTAPTLGNLISTFTGYGPSGSAARIIDRQIRTKIRQIKPEISDSEISAVFNQPLPMGTVRYIWMNDSRQVQLSNQSSLPTWINPTSLAPDGTVPAANNPSTFATSNWVAGNRNFVNIEEEQGYPSPWDCFGSGPDRTKSDMTWQRSSGFNCLQGILRFRNCVEANTDPWDCPC